MSPTIDSQQSAEKAFERYPELLAMFAELDRFTPEILPSRYWRALNRKNLRQLADTGYDNFKRTLARNYFTWIVNPFNHQIRFLMLQAGAAQSFATLARALLAPRHECMKKRHTIYYNLLTELLWRYVVENDPDDVLTRLEEPLEGNPPKLLHDGRLISQDLANSVLEYKAIVNHTDNAHQIRTIMELGPGYGRTAYVFLTLHPACRYVLVDIPPALFVAQRYLATVFPDRGVFRFRAWSDFSKVRDEMSDSSIIFLMPNQLALLPDKYVDLFVNISSLHEMRLDQIRYYFSEIDRLTRKYFYFKQKTLTTIPIEKQIIREADYPVREHWRLIFRRQCEVQKDFFEALYELPPGQRSCTQRRLHEKTAQ